MELLIKNGMEGFRDPFIALMKGNFTPIEQGFIKEKNIGLKEVKNRGTRLLKGLNI